MLLWIINFSSPVFHGFILLFITIYYVFHVTILNRQKPNEIKKYQKFPSFLALLFALPSILLYFFIYYFYLFMFLCPCECAVTS